LTKLYLDPGHGGTDSGAVGNGILEKNLTLSISQKIKAILENDYTNIEVKMSRVGDTYPTLTERTNEANAWGADCYVSPHINANASSAPRGFSSYVYPSPGAKTIAFQNVLHEEIVRAISGTGATDRGKLQADFHVLRESNMIACLTENLFISNAADAALLKSEDFLNKIARGHAVGIALFFGLPKKVVTPPPSQGVLYRVITGSFSNRDNAEAHMAKLKADGYDSFIEVK
jgi:N-acetylmuramoyl-L-alanine amidase